MSYKALLLFDHAEVVLSWSGIEYLRCHEESHLESSEGDCDFQKEYK
jgi:hypothetical protein